MNNELEKMGTKVIALSKDRIDKSSCILFSAFSASLLARSLGAFFAAYGFVLFYIAGSTMVSQASYPPYGLAALSFTGLSCYLIYSGLYFSAISVSQDMTLRQTIKNSVMEESKLLDRIGSAQMEKELQGRVLTVAKKASNIMEQETGIEAPMTEEDMKDYLELVIKEVQKKS